MSIALCDVFARATRGNRPHLRATRAQRPSFVSSPGVRLPKQRTKGKVMKLKSWIQIVLVGTLSAAAGKPPRMPVYYEDTIVTMTVVNENVLGVKEKDHA